MDSYSSFSFDKEKFKPIVHAPMKKIIVIYKITDNLLLWNAHGLSFFFFCKIVIHFFIKIQHLDNTRYSLVE